MLLCCFDVLMVVCVVVMFRCFVCVLFCRAVVVMMCGCVVVLFRCFVA